MSLTLEEWIEQDEIVDNVVPMGPDLSSPEDLNPKKFVKSIFSVYNHLGGDQWLLDYARENETEFFRMLKAIIPKNLQIEDITANLIPEVDLSEKNEEELEEIYKNAIGE